MDKLEKINAFTYNSLGHLLFEMVPEYKRIIDLDTQFESDSIGGYLFMNDFSLLLGDKIQNDFNSSFVTNSFKFINTVGESTNLEVINIIKIGILEILYTINNTVRQKVQENLNEKLQSIFKDFSKYYY